MSSVKITSLTIPNGATISNGLAGTGKFLRNIAIYAPSSLAGAITVEASDTEGGTFRTLQSGGTDVAVAAGKCVVLIEVPFIDMRLKTTVAPGADEVFAVVGQEEYR